MQTRTDKQNAKHCDTWNHEETKGTGTHGVRSRDDTENVRHRDAEGPFTDVVVQLCTE